jgi:hypothetical protein
MKVLFLIAATVTCFGLSLSHESTAPVSEVTPAVAIIEVEEPVMDVLLDTVVVTAYAPKTIAANVR